MTHKQRAHRYLQASIKAGLTGLPHEHKQAYRQQMAEHERAYAHVREHAIVGADSDFDRPLSAGEREHQRHLRDTEKLDHAQVLKLRSELRARQNQPSRARRTLNTGRTAASRAGRTAASNTLQAANAARSPAQRALNTTGLPKAASGLGWKIIGGVLLLILLYLAIMGKGPGAISGIVGLASSGIAAFMNPHKDPLAGLETTLRSNKTPQGPGDAAGIANQAGEAFAAVGTAAAGAAEAIGGVTIEGNHPATSRAEKREEARYGAGTGSAPSPSSIRPRPSSPARVRRFRAELRRFDREHHITGPNSATP